MQTKVIVGLTDLFFIFLCFLGDTAGVTETAQGRRLAVGKVVQIMN